MKFKIGQTVHYKHKRSYSFGWDSVKATIANISKNSKKIHLDNGLIFNKDGSSNSNYITELMVYTEEDDRKDAIAFIESFIHNEELDDFAAAKFISTEILVGFAETLKQARKKYDEEPLEIV